MKKVFHLTLFLFVLCTFISSAMAQISIAPTNLFLDSNSRFGTYMVINSSNQAQEISVDFFFGYSNTDKNGERILVSSDTSFAENHSISSHIRAFPQNFILPPGQRQVIRLRVNPPNNLPDGTYWARIKTSSTPETPPVEVQSTETVSARVGITIEQVSGIYFKKGDVSTGIEVDQIRTQFSEDGTLAVLADHRRTGNSPFLGSITTSLVNANGNVVSEEFATTTLYFDGTHKQKLNVQDVPSGDYTVQVRFDTQRSDVPREDLVQMEPVTATTTVTIPAGE